MVTSLLKQLIQIESVSGKEKEIAEFIYKYAEEKGFEPQKVDNNIIFSLGEGDKTLFFNAHIDTVEASDNWENPPFEAVEKEGKIYGLGASDNKAQVASLLKAAEKIQEKQLDKEIIFMFVEKEELDGSGTKKCLEWLDQNKEWEEAAAVVTEPTGLDWIYDGCKGTAWIELEIKTEGGHASKDLKNPIEEVYHIYDEFAKLLPSNKPQPKIELTKIEAGDSINKIPSKAEAKFDIRTTPQFSSEEVKQGFQKLAENSNCDISVSFAEEPSPPSNSQGAEIVEHVKETADIESSKFAKAANDSCFFTEKGINAAVIGSGNHGCMHKPDEFVQKDKLEKGVDLFVEIAEKW